MIYPPEILRWLHTDTHDTVSVRGAASGLGANFECGCIVTFAVDDPASEGSEQHIGFTSNGCGYMVAAARVLAAKHGHSGLHELNGLLPAELRSLVETQLGEVPVSRTECVNAAIQALRNAYADLRRLRVAEFTGEQALICTCFGVSEDRLKNEIRKKQLSSVEEVGAACRAGTGCGSCTMLIQELLEMAVWED